jgi:hypothetical protein
MNTISHIFKLASTTAVILILGFTVVLLEGCATHTHTPTTFAYVCYTSWSTCA